MKGASRLAQSLGQKVIKKMGVFCVFSRSARAFSTASQKRDSRADFSLPKPHCPRPTRPTWTIPALSYAAGNLAGIDTEYFARGANAGECRRISAGHPDLRAKF